MPNYLKWVRKLSWFILENMSKDRPFNEAFASSFSSEEIQELDALTDTLFYKDSRAGYDETIETYGNDMVPQVKVNITRPSSWGEGYTLEQAIPMLLDRYHQLYGKQFVRKW